MQPRERRRCGYRWRVDRGNRNGTAREHHGECDHEDDLDGGRRPRGLWREERHAKENDARRSQSDDRAERQNQTELSAEPSRLRAKGRDDQAAEQPGDQERGERE